MNRARRRVAVGLPILVSGALVLAACGSGETVQAVPDSAVAAPAESEASVARTSVEATRASGGTTPADKGAPARPATDGTDAPRTDAKGGDAKGGNAKGGDAIGSVAEPAAPKTAPVAESAKAKTPKAARAGEAVGNGATDVGITRDGIKLGSINMHGMALANVITAPQVRGNLATISAINDRGGVLGRRLSTVDCDDGPGEVSRAKACLKRLVTQDRIFALVSGVDWATASIHDDLKQHRLPYVGSWAYSQTEWQDPFMFPTHMSMIHEAMAGAGWVRDVVKPKTYGLICLTSPEMQLACNEVKRVLDASGSKLVKKVDVSISETSMSAQVLSMRAANPDHIVHYVINPATIMKFIVESSQQNYWPAKGMSGNHVASETMGSLIGKFPIDRYWFNTTYRLWGSEFMATMTKYARANRGVNHHIVQAGYVGINMFADAAAAVGPNLTRDRLRAELANGSVWKADASLDQKFSYTPSERGANWRSDLGQGREFMYRYSGQNTVSAPDGSPTGFTPDPDMFVIQTR